MNVHIILIVILILVTAPFSTASAERKKAAEGCEGLLEFRSGVPQPGPLYKNSDMDIVRIDTSENGDQFIVLRKQRGPGTQKFGSFARIVSLMKILPRFFHELGFEVSGDEMRVPSVATLNRRAALLRRTGNPLAPAVNFIPDWSSGMEGESKGVVAKNWALGRIVISQGILMAHDLGDHALGYLILPSEIAERLQNRAAFYLNIKKNPILRKNRELVRMSKEFLNSEMEAVDQITDNTTASLSGLLSYVAKRGKLDEDDHEMFSEELQKYFYQIVEAPDSVFKVRERGDYEWSPRQKIELLRKSAKDDVEKEELDRLIARFDLSSELPLNELAKGKADGLLKHVKTSP